MPTATNCLGLILVTLLACSAERPRPQPRPLVQVPTASGEVVELEPPPPPAPSAGSLDDPNEATLRAPETFEARFVTTAGDFVILCHRAWAPNGADRLYNLLVLGFYRDVAMYRAIDDFVVQFGIHGEPAIADIWKEATIPPDPPLEENLRGRVTFAQSADPASRTTQLFINRKDNASLSKMGFSPVCEVMRGMDTVDRVYSGYGDRAGRDQTAIERGGNVYLRERYPELDYIIRTELLP